MRNVLQPFGQSLPAQISFPKGSARGVIKAQIPAGSCHQHACTHAGAANEVTDHLHQDRCGLRFLPAICPAQVEALFAPYGLTGNTPETWR